MAFSGCARLEAVSFPLASAIYPSAFLNCVNLISLYLMRPSMTTLSNTNAFTSTPIGGYSDEAGRFGSIFVPASLYAAYIANANWKAFSERFVSV